MSITRRAATLGGLSLLAGTSVSTVSRAEFGSFLGIGEGIEDFILATDAYIYGYPLVTMEMTRRIVTNVAEPVGTRGPMGHIVKLRQYPDAAFRDVTAPNADTLYTSSFFYVGKEPWVLSIPDMNGRYALFPMLDGWTTVFQVPGKRTTGTGAQTYAITGPGWKGALPAGVKEYKSPTNIVWWLGRIYCTGTPEDYAEVHKLQDEFKLVPLSSYGKPYTPPPGTVDPSIDMKTAVREQVNRMDAVAYFALLCELMKDNPPAAADAPQLAKFASIGVVPGQDFDASKLKADFVKRIPEVGFDRIMLQFKINKDFKDENGWAYTTKTLDRPETTRHLVFVYEPRKLPRVLSPEEVLRLLEAAPGPKHKAALSVAYGAGLRAMEVVALKVCDIDSKRMMLRVEQGSGIVHVLKSGCRWCDCDEAHDPPTTIYERSDSDRIKTMAGHENEAHENAERIGQRNGQGGLRLASQGG